MLVAIFKISIKIKNKITAYLDNFYLDFAASGGYADLTISLSIFFKQAIRDLE